MFAEAVTFTSGEVTLIVLALLLSVVVLVGLCTLLAWGGCLTERRLVTGSWGGTEVSDRPGLPLLAACGSASVVLGLLFWPLAPVAAPALGALVGHLKRSDAW